jgi:hypothetical protein
MILAEILTREGRMNGVVDYDFKCGVQIGQVTNKSSFIHPDFERL